MELTADGLRLSATDLASHLACAHLTQLDRAAARGVIERPHRREDPTLELLIERGFAHERAYVEHLRASGRRVVNLREIKGDTAARKTIEAMRTGADVIVQAHLLDGRWTGYADLLVRVEAPSAIGDWSYEAVDTKLAVDTRAGTILQLCLYTELVGAIQGCAPRRFHVVKPGPEGIGFASEEYRFADFEAYFSFVKARLLAAVDEGDGALAHEQGPTYPLPVAHCDICRWWPRCNQRRRDDDHLSFVAGIRTAQIAELQHQGIPTLTAWAESPVAVRNKPRRGSREALEALHEQAKVQFAGRLSGRPTHELIPPEAGRGLARLPEPDPADVFFDIEGDPFVEGGGMEYLLGWAHGEGGGGLHYERLWATDRAAEKRAFEAFIDFVMQRWAEHPGLHVYHFAPYEPSALKRLASRHATREDELDRLLRGERFVDLYAVARQAVRASVERYSIKDLEPFFGFTRAVELTEVRPALRRTECALELRTPIEDADRALVEGYNRDDCLATEGLRAWLESLRVEAITGGAAIERPAPQDGAASDEATATSAEIQALFERLVHGQPEDHAAWGDDDRARWLLAHMLEYFRREGKVAWWEHFRLRDLVEEDGYDEDRVVVGLTLVEERPGKTKGTPVHRYHFPPQELRLGAGAKLRALGDGRSIGTVVAVDFEAGTIDVKKHKATRDEHPGAVFGFDIIRAKPLPDALRALAEFVVEHGVDAPGAFRAARDLLLKRPPRRSAAPGGPLRRAGESPVDAARRLARELDEGVLAIQGPPGTGKTYTGARMILGLLGQGKRVGVTAVSHQVVINLIKATFGAAGEAGIGLEAVHRGKGDEDDDLPPGLEVTRDNDAALDALDDGKLVGGTAWLWAREDAEQCLDYLFVDEAGQMSLAMVLAAARSARNLVLLGDPQQLEQPQQGAHPEGAEFAALVHVLDGHPTISDERGHFLDTTHRMHPALCAFTSRLYYEDRLGPGKGLENQALDSAGPFTGSGLFYVPVEHEANSNASVEEVEAVTRVVSRLLDGGAHWTDHEERRTRLAPADVLVVAPYNAQVAALRAAVPPGVPVGTVDKFQGQQAPVVIYSMATSSAAEAPRGLGFLYSPNRFNVATSRARCACILVASPRLMEAECRTVEQMRWVNGLCAFEAQAQRVEVPGL